MFPLKDNIPLARFPLVTVALVAINVIVYLLEIRHGGSFFGGPSEQRGGALRGDPLRAHPSRRRTATWSGYGRSKASAARSPVSASRAVAALAATAAARAARDLGRRCSPRCSCTAASFTSLATCSSWRSSAPPSRTRWGGGASWPSTCSAASSRWARRCSCAPTRPSPRSAPRGRSRRCSAATSCCIRARACSASCSSIFFVTIVEVPALLLLGFWFVVQLALRRGRPGQPGRRRRRRRLLRARRRLRSSACSLIRLFVGRGRPESPPLPAY